jgi:hypothetical protein
MTNMQFYTSVEEPLQTALAVLTSGIASLEAVADAVTTRRDQRPAIGQLLLSHRKLTMRQVFEILKKQATCSKRFGEIAVEMGYVTNDEITEMLQLQAMLCPSLLDVLLSRNLITPEQAESIYDNLELDDLQASNVILESCGT